MCTNKIVAFLLCLFMVGLVQAQIELPPSPTTLESYDAPGYFLVATTSGGPVSMVQGGDEMPEGQWNLLPGLAAGDGRVTFESVFIPDTIMRHRGFVFFTDPRANDNLFLNDSTFVVEPGLADPEAVSFRSVNYQDRYLMHNATFGLVLEVPTDPATATFKFPPLNVPFATDPVPEDEAEDVRPDIILSWRPGAGALSHNLYFGISLDDVNNATPGSDQFLRNQTSAEYDPASLGLELGGTYYWRVDEVNNLDPESPYKGAVWSFTLETPTYAVEDVSVSVNRAIKVGSEPEKMVDGSGLLPEGGHSTAPTEMWQSTGALTEDVLIDFELDRLYKLDEVWIWNFNHEFEQFLNFSLKDVTVEYATEPNEWIILGDLELVQGSGVAGATPQVIAFGGTPVQYVRFTAKSSYGGVGVGLAEVQFRYIPTFAREPEPEAGAEGVLPDAMLSWRPGREAVTHQVHAGLDAEAVSAGQSLAATSNVSSYDSFPLDLQLSEKYYWMITEVNNAETPTSWDSDVWDFNTPDFLVVDDMESYNDEDNLIYETWLDGYADNSSGSQVGYDNPPYAEEDTVHGGGQSMPFIFGRNGLTTSEARLVPPSMQNWKRSGVTTLVVWFRGQPGNGTPQLYAKINNTRINYTGSSGSLTAPMWKQWNIDLTSVAAASGVASLTLGVEGPGTGTLFFDDIRLYKDAGPQTGVGVDPGTNGLAASYPMNDSVADASGNGRNGTADIGASFAAGPAGYGRALVLDGVSGFATLPVGSVVQSSNSMTIAAWVRVDAAATWARLFDFNNDTDVYMFMAPSNGSAAVFAITTASNAGESVLTAPGAIGADGMWHHVGVTIDGTTSEISMYIDGTLADSTMTNTLPSAVGNTTNNWIGRSAWDGDPYLTGAVDEFRIYNRALSAAEIQFLLGDR